MIPLRRRIMEQYDKIEKQIKTILEDLSKKTAASKWSNPEWTRQIKDRVRSGLSLVLLPLMRK